jgi:hypothetical protein
MIAKLLKRKGALLVLCSAVLIFSLAVAVIAQTVQEQKKCLTQEETQNQFSYQKMVKSQQFTRQMSQNQYSYEKKTQNQNANKKMSQQGSADNGSQSQQGQERNGGNRNGNG